MSSLAAKYHTINFNSMSFPFLENLLRFTRVHSPVLERREICGDDLVYHFNNDTKILVEFLQKYNRIKFLKTAGYQDKTYWFYDELIEKYFGLGIESQKGNCQLIFRFFEDHLTIKQNDIISLFFNDSTAALSDLMAYFPPSSFESPNLTIGTSFQTFTTLIFPSRAFEAF